MSKKDRDVIKELEEKFDELFGELEEEDDGFFDDVDVFDDLDDAEDLSPFIVLNDENGNEVEFEFLDLIEYEEEEYIVITPVGENDGAGEVVILKLEESDNEYEESYVSVDNEDVLNAVFEIFREKFKDEFNFVD